MNSRQRFIQTILLSSCAVLLFSLLAWAQLTPDTLLSGQPLDHDVYTAGTEVSVRSDVNGDVVAAGQRIRIAGDVTGDVIAAGQHVEINSEVGDDVRAAGQTVRVSSPVSGHVVAAGYHVTIDQPVADWAWLAGYTVEVNERIGGDLRIRANSIMINSEVAGDLVLISDELALGANAVVRGSLTWHSDEQALISPNAQIEGEFIQKPTPGILDSITEEEGYALPLNTIVAVTVLYLLFARTLKASTERVRTRPVSSILLGLALVITTPVLAIFLMFTGIGLWLGLALLLIYVVMLLVGMFTGLFMVSDLVLSSVKTQAALWKSLLAIAFTVIVVGLLTNIPWVGSLSIVAIGLFGIGALCSNAWASQRSNIHPSLQAA